MTFLCWPGAVPVLGHLLLYRITTDMRRVCLIKSSPPTWLPCPSKHKTQRRFDVGPPSSLTATAD